MSDNSNNNCILLSSVCDSPIRGIKKIPIYIHNLSGGRYKLLLLCVDWICNEGVCDRIQNPTRASLSSSSDDDEDDDYNNNILYYNSKKKNKYIDTNVRLYRRDNRNGFQRFSSYFFFYLLLFINFFSPFHFDDGTYSYIGIVTDCITFMRIHCINIIYTYCTAGRSPTVISSSFRRRYYYYNSTAQKPIIIIIIIIVKSEAIIL